MGFIVGLAFEIMLDIGDVKGDDVLDIETLSTRFVMRTAAFVSTVLYSTLLILDPLPFFVCIDARLYQDYLLSGVDTHPRRFLYFRLKIADAGSVTHKDLPAEEESISNDASGMYDVSNRSAAVRGHPLTNQPFTKNVKSKKLRCI